MGVEDASSGIAEAERLADCVEGWLTTSESDGIMVLVTDVKDVVIDD